MGSQNGKERFIPTTRIFIKRITGGLKNNTGHTSGQIITGVRQPAGNTRLASLLWMAGILFLLGLAPLRLAVAGTVAPFSIDGTVPDSGAQQFIDPFGSVQELGATNGSATKLGVIHTAAVSMLNFTNPNGQTDIVNIWLDTKEDADGDTWLYFAWERVATSGSSVITYEFQQAGLPLGCNYTPAVAIDRKLPETTGETDLINNCNPWSGRQAKDFMIVWDFKGGANDIILRNFDGMAFDSVTLNPDVSDAMLTADTSMGEGAINLSKSVFPQPATQCLSIGNIITGTITGNSDNADYKDTVLADFTDQVSISNCAKVIIRKETLPENDTTSFGFTHELAFLGTVWPASFSLSDNGSQTYDNVVIPGTGYKVTENDPAPDFKLTGIVCSNSNTNAPAVNTDVSSRSATFDLGRGETVDCTFTNTKRGKILIDKVTYPGGLTQSFTFTPSWSNSTFGLKDGDTPKDSGPLAPGTYSVSEGAVNGWDLTSATCDDNSPVTAIDVAPGETVTCTFTNTKRGKIIVDKVTDPGGSSQSFTFTPSWSNSTFNLKDGDTPEDSGSLVPGTYNVSEGSESGWDLTSATCNDNSPVTAIDVAPGETVTCTFNNKIQRGNIIVDKVTDPGGSTQDFTFTPSWSNSSFSLKDGDTPEDSGSLLPTSESDTYSVSEGPETGWDLTSASCDDGSPVNAIELAPGETVTCTFYNKARASIRIQKKTQGGYDGEFGFTSASLSNFDLTTSKGSSSFKEFLDLTADTYDVSENTAAVPNWTQVSGTCSDGSSPASIGLGAGEIVTCTFTNAPKTGAIKIIKTRKFADAASGDANKQPHPDVKFVISGGSLAAPVELKPTDSNGEVCYDAAGAGLVFSEIAGNYTVREIVPEGYVADGLISKTVPVDKDASCTSGTLNEINFSNTPLTNVTVTAASIDPGATHSMIECYEGSENEAGEITIGDSVKANSGFADDQSLELQNQLPLWPDKLIICTIKIDP